MHFIQAHDQALFGLVLLAASATGWVNRAEWLPTRSNPKGIVKNDWPVPPASADGAWVWQDGPLWRFDVRHFHDSAEYQLVLRELASRSELGLPALSQNEFDDILKRPQAQILYRDFILDLAAPAALLVQEMEVRNATKVWLSQKQIDLGVSFASKHSDVLMRAERAHGIAPPDLIALLNAESKLGGATGAYHVMNVFLGQLAYLDEAETAAFNSGAYNQLGSVARDANQGRLREIKARAAFNLAIWLRAAKNQSADPTQTLGSGSGKIGISQFLPESFRYGQDGDGDGKIDLGSVNDAVMSTANYLALHGYDRKSKRARIKAIQSYNPSPAFGEAVISYAQRISQRLKGNGR